jgi:uncharacterized protein YcbK (DUF882 family)
MATAEFHSAAFIARHHSPALPKSLFGACIILKLNRILAVSSLALSALFLSPSSHAATRAEETVVSGAPESRLAAAGHRYELRLRSMHTGESLNIVYRIGDTYVPDALDKLNHFLRDRRTEEASTYDPAEFDLLHDLLVRLHRPGGVIDVVCGYRTPQTNEFLRTRGSNTGVAKNSQHIQAKAIDIRIAGIRTRVIRDAALALGQGGVGYYPRSQFVHVDVGPVRKWSYFGRGTD